MDLETPSSRASLGFAAAVNSAFRFLVDDFHFRKVGEEVTIVRFESSSVFVIVYHGRISFEINVEMGELTRGGLPENPFTIEDIIYLVDPQKAATYRPFQVRTADTVIRFVSEIAQMTKDYAAQALKGDRDFFEQLSASRTQRATTYTKELRLNRTRTEVETAWHQKNYPRVIELYDSMQEDLTPSEGKRLAYAKKNSLS